MTDGGLVAETTDPTAARIEPSQKVGAITPERTCGAKLPNIPSVLTVSPSTAELLDPGMLVWRNDLGRELTAQPIRLFRQNDR